MYKVGIIYCMLKWFSRKVIVISGKNKLGVIISSLLSVAMPYPSNSMQE